MTMALLLRFTSTAAHGYELCRQSAAHVHYPDVALVMGWPYLSDTVRCGSQLEASRLEQ